MEIYTGQFVLYLLLFVRATSMIVAAPVFGNQAVPAQVKVAVGLFLALVLYPLVHAMGVNVDLTLGGFVLAALKEAAVGLVIGFAAQMVLLGVAIAGEIISFELGMSMATAISPDSGMANPVIGTLLQLLMTLVFLTVNGHHFLLQAVRLSYDTVPIGAFTVTAAQSSQLTTLAAASIVIGVKLAAPVIVASFLVNVALAVLTRVSPQINVFMLSFQLKIGVGVVVMMAAAPVMVVVFKHLLAGFEDDMLQLLRAL